MSTPPPVPLTATQLHVVLSGERHALQLLVNTDNELIGVSNPQLLRRWLDSRAPQPHNVLSASNITEIQRRDVRFFGETPCWFEGCEELREAYKAEKAALEAKPDCKNCETSALMRKYFKKVADAQLPQTPA